MTYGDKRLLALLGIKSIRWILELWLVVAIWHNAHWSVALSLTLVCAYVELSALLLNLRNL